MGPVTFKVEYELENVVIGVREVSDLKNLQAAWLEGREVEVCGGTYLVAGFSYRCEPQAVRVRLVVPAGGEEYYLQDSRQIVGNCMLWWGKGLSGYVTDLDKAHVFTAAEMKAFQRRDTDVFWLKSMMDAIASRTVDCQHVERR